MILYYLGYGAYLGARWLWRRAFPSYDTTYQWFLDWEPIPGAVEPISPPFDPDMAGRVTIRTTVTRRE